MKTTLKLDGLTALVIQPEADHVALTVTMGSIPVRTVFIDLNRTGALLAALEGAAEAAQANKDRLDGKRVDVVQVNDLDKLRAQLKAS